jgi:hypothetical protein
MPFKPLQRFNSIMGAAPQDNYGGLLSPQDQRAATQAFRAQLASGLLSAAGPQRMPVSLGQAIGGSLPQAMQARDYRAETGIRNDQIRRQIDAENKHTASLGKMRGLIPSMVPEGQAELYQGLFDVAPDVALQGLFSPQNRSALDEKLGVVEGRLGRPLTDTEVMTLAGGGATTNINIGDKLQEPIPLDKLDSVRMPDGTAAPIGMTLAEARKAGAVVMSTAEQARATQADQAIGILDQLEEMAIGPDGVFKNVEPGVANRVTSALTFAIDMIDQKDPRAAQFQDLSQATIAPFIKFLGESGALATGDVNRAIGLLPRIWPLPDTRDVATDKLKDLREIIMRGQRNLNAGIRVKEEEEEIPPPPPGFTLD